MYVYYVSITKVSPTNVSDMSYVVRSLHGSECFIHARFTFYLTAYKTMKKWTIRHGAIGGGEVVMCDGGGGGLSDP